MAKVGDIFKQCTCALQPDKVCAYSDLRKIQWSINKNKEQLRLVLKRQQTMGRMRWHRCGTCGCVSHSSSWLISPPHFPPISSGEWCNRREGKVIVAAFHKAIIEEVKSRVLRIVRVSIWGFRTSTVRMRVVTLAEWPKLWI